MELLLYIIAITNILILIVNIQFLVDRLANKKLDKKNLINSNNAIVDRINDYAKKRLFYIDDYLICQEGEVFKPEYEAMKKEINYLLEHIEDLKTEFNNGKAN